MHDDLTRRFFELVAARKGHFRLESGHHSASWLDLDALFASPAALEPLVARMAELIRPYEPEVICGPLIGGAFLAQSIAHALQCEFAYTERVAEGEGLYQAAYRLPPAFRLESRRVAIVDDVMSAGSASMATHSELQRHGAITVVTSALMVFGNRGLALFEQAGVPVESVGRGEFQVWGPEECPLCATAEPLVKPG